MSASKGAAIVRGDALSIPLADESVDLIVTSPPYFALRSYSDGGEHYEGQIGSEATPTQFLEALWAVTAECWRVLKPSGSLFVNLGDKYAGSGGHNNGGLQGATSQMGGRKHTKARDANRADAVKATRRQAPDRYNQASDGIRAKSLMGLPWRYAIGCVDGQADPDGKGWILRAELVWSKPNGLPESVTDRVRRSHEQWFHLTKCGTYYAGMDDLRTEPLPETIARGADHRADPGRSRREGEIGGPAHTLAVGQMCNPLGALPRSVWTIPTMPLIVPEWLEVDHFAAFPTEWPRRIITGWSPSGICVECGEGRRPTTDKVKVARAPSGEQYAGKLMRRSDEPMQVPNLVTETTITGESCGCASPDAPTTPAVILDPFGGTGTTAMVARALGRFGVSLDLSADYLRLARWRIFDSGQAAKVAAKSDRDRQGVLL